MLRRSAILPASLLELCFIPGSWRRLHITCFLSILVMTSPAPDVWPSILTDYTYDSELDIADGVPRNVLTQHLVPLGNHGYIHKLGRSASLLWNCDSIPFDILELVKKRT